MKSLADKFLEKLGAQKVEHSKASGLYHAVDEIAKRLNIKSPDIYITNDKIIPSDFMLEAFSRTPNAASISKDKIIISKSFLKLFDSENLMRPVSEEIKAILGHEMHHCAYRTTAVSAAILPVFALPVVAVTATYLYDRAKKKAAAEKDVSPKNVAKHIDESAKKAEKIIDKKSGGSPDETENGFLKQVLNAGKYIAMATIGLGTGLYIARHGSRFNEFAADRFGALVSSKVAMANGLKKVHKAMENSTYVFKNEPSIMDIISSETIYAHPSLRERTSHIRSM